MSGEATADWRALGIGFPRDDPGLRLEAAECGSTSGLTLVRSPSTSLAMAEYDPEIIQTFARRLYRRALLGVGVSTALGVLIGLVATPFVIQSLPLSLAVRCPDWVVVVMLGLIGLGQGLERSFLLRLQAQQALCQLQIERNTRGPGSGDAPRH